MHEFSWCAAGHRENVRALVRVGNDIRDHLRSPSSRHPWCPSTTRLAASRMAVAAPYNIHFGLAPEHRDAPERALKVTRGGCLITD